jgi:hypothetical protein
MLQVYSGFSVNKKCLGTIDGYFLQQKADYKQDDSHPKIKWLRHHKYGNLKLQALKGFKFIQYKQVNQIIANGR